MAPPTISRTESRRRTAAPRSARRRGKGVSPLPKLTRPHPDRIFPRTRLFDLLDRTRAAHRVVWVSAPGGAGKTSLAASYLGARGLPVLWYQVDSGDGDVASFFYFMGLAVRQAAPRRRKAMPVLTPEYLGDVATFTRNFFREAYRHLPRNVVVVLDNYQDAPEDCALHDVLRVAMGEVPEGMNLLALSRMEPPSVLARLRLFEHAACLDSNTMQLTLEETEGISALRIGEHALDPDALAALHERAQGWAAGVVLLLEQAGSAGAAEISKLPTGQKLLFDYFAGEVLSRNEPLVREFLLKTALFPKVSAASARSLTGIAHAGAILEDLTGRNYFTVRHPGPEGDTYQYHPLFRDFLLSMAEQAFGRDQLACLQEAAGRILIEAGQESEGMGLLIAAKTWPSVIQQIRQQAPIQLRIGRWQTLSHWIAALPTDAVAQDPWLVFWRAQATMPRDLIAAREDFRQAYLLFKALGDAAGSYLAWSGAVDTYMYLWQDFVPLDYWIEQMTELRERFPAYPSLDVEAQATCGMIGAATYRQVDQPMMREWLAAGIALLDHPIDPAVKVRIGSLVLFYLVYREHRMVECRLLLAKLRAVAEDPDIGILPKLMWHMTRAAILATDGAADEAIAVVGEGFELAAESGVHHVDFFLHTQAVYAHLAKLDVEGAARHVKSIEALIPQSQAFESGLYHYMSTWVLLGQNQAQLALEHVCRANEETTRTGCSSHAVYGAVAQAQVLYECGRPEEAMEMIEPAREWGMRMDAAFIEINYQCLKALEALDRQDQNDCRGALAAALGLWKERAYAAVPWIGWRGPLLARLFHQALVLEIEPDFVCSLIRNLRLTPPADEALSEKWPFPVRLRTLGDVSVEIDNRTMARPRSHRRPLELLQALVALGGRGVDDGRVADALWPQAEGDAARQNLKMNVHRLRALLPEGALLWSEGKLSLDDQRIWVDVWALERELERLERSTPQTGSEARPLVDRVFRLYRGDFLPDAATSWAPAMRERLRNRTLRLVARAADEIGESEPAEALSIYERAIELDPLREPLYQGLMRCYLRLRQPAEGLRVHRRCDDILRRELGVAPAAETEALRLTLKAAQ